MSKRTIRTPSRAYNLSALEAGPGRYYFRNKSFDQHGRTSSRYEDHLYPLFRRGYCSAAASPLEPLAANLLRWITHTVDCSIWNDIGEPIPVRSACKEDCWIDLYQNIKSEATSDPPPVLDNQSPQRAKNGAHEEEYDLAHV